MAPPRMLAWRRRVTACRVSGDVRRGVVARNGVHGAAKVSGVSRRKRGEKDFPRLAFSLWRSAFLSDKTGYRSDTEAGAVKFLSEMLQNNAIAYSQERSSKDWTFNYYATNAHLRLEDLQDLNIDWELGFPMPMMKSPKDRWGFLQKAFEKALRCLERDLKAKRERQSAKKAAAAK
jgi:hypothetical protein